MEPGCELGLHPELLGWLRLLCWRVIVLAFILVIISVVNARIHTVAPGRCVDLYGHPL